MSEPIASQAIEIARSFMFSDTRLMTASMIFKHTSDLYFQIALIAMFVFACGEYRDSNVDGTSDRMHGNQLRVNARRFEPSATRSDAAQATISEIESRMYLFEQSDVWGVHLRAKSIRDTFFEKIVENQNIGDDQILSFRLVTIDHLAASAEVQQRVLERIPNARELPSHRYAVALLAGVSGLAPEEISMAAPDLGLIGSARRDDADFSTPSAQLERSTAIHDFTDWISGDPVPFLNRSVWGVESSEGSAMVSVREGLSGKT